MHRCYGSALQALSAGGYEAVMQLLLERRHGEKV